MKHANNVLIVCFRKNYENLCLGHERPRFGVSCEYSIYMAKTVLENFVRLHDNSNMYQLSEPLKIQRTPSESAVLTTNKGNAVII
jgi:hypothetical protein